MVFGGGLILGICAFCAFCTMLYGGAFLVIVVLPDMLCYRLFKKHVPWHDMPWPGINDGKPLAPGTDDFVAVRERVSHEHAQIEHAMQTDPNDPALLQRIAKLTAEVESIDRRVVARLPFHELVAGRPPKHPTRHYPER